MLLDLPRRPDIYNCLLLEVCGGSYPRDEKQKLIAGIQFIRLSHASSLPLHFYFYQTDDIIT